MDTAPYFGLNVEIGDATHTKRMFIACIVVPGRAGLNYAESKERRLTWVFVMVERRGQGEGSHTPARASCDSSLPPIPKEGAPGFFSSSCSSGVGARRQGQA